MTLLLMFTLKPPKIQMTTVYKFEFEKDEETIEVHFVDRSASIDDAEALAQISSLHRRQ